MPLNRIASLEIDRLSTNKNINLHTDFKPSYNLQYEKLIDSINNLTYRDTGFINHHNFKLFWRKVLKENLIIVDSGEFHLTINPLFNFQTTQTTNNKNYTQNTRGILISGKIGKKISFSTSYLENSASFVDYLNSFVLKNKVIPGQGMARGISSYDFSQASGYVSYQADKYFNIQIGHGKNFIGNGYRSLLLSDNSYSYPYLKITTSIWKLEYTNLYTCYTNMSSNHPYTQGFDKKYSSTHYLSYNITNSLSLGFFETIVWLDHDSTGRRGFDVNYLNPIIFYHSVNFAMDSPDNSLLGLNASYKLTNKVRLYGQLVIDDFNFAELKKDPTYFQEKYGFQTGLKIFDLLGLKNLHLQIEYNQVRPYTYAHKDESLSYTNYNQALAHPLGANFCELVSFLNYKYQDFYFQYKFNFAIYGADTSKSNWGHDLFKSDFTASRTNTLFSNGNNIGQGVRTLLMYNEFSVGYVLNPVTNMVFELGITNRSEKSDLSNSNLTYYYFAFKTNLFNNYYDF